MYNHGKTWWKWISKSELKEFRNGGGTPTMLSSIAVQQQSTVETSVQAPKAKKKSVAAARTTIISATTKKPKAFVVPSIVIETATPKSSPKKLNHFGEEDTIDADADDEQDDLPKIVVATVELPDEVPPEEAEAIKQPQNIQDDPAPPALVVQHADEKSRRFSQLPPARIESPGAKTIGSFAVIPTLQNNPEEGLEPVLTSSISSTTPPTSTAPTTSTTPTSDASLGVTLSAGAAEKSRRFSKLPPASTDSPNAVKLGSKFTMIPTEETPDKKE